MTETLNEGLYRLAVHAAIAIAAATRHNDTPGKTMLLVDYFEKVAATGNSDLDGWRYLFEGGISWVNVGTQHAAVHLEEDEDQLQARWAATSTSWCDEMPHG